MPEFPEVNVQVRYLRERIVGWTLTDCGWKGKSHLKGLEDSEKDAACAMLADGNVIEDVTQRGKQVIFRMRRGLVTSHLMFKGRWSVEGDPFVSNYKRHRKEPNEKYNTFWMTNQQGQTLHFNDPDYRGHVLVFPDIQDPADAEHLAKLGPEVLALPEIDPSFANPWSVEDFQEKAGRSRQAIKVFLLDQKRQSGIGNVYVCEALYETGIDPNRPANSLSGDDLAAIFESSRSMIQQAIDTDLDYDQILNIYGKKEDPKGNPVSKDKVGGRDTYWVPAVQK